MNGCFEEFIKLMKFDANKIKWLTLNTSITADNNALQAHHTPDSICDQMIEMYKPNFNNQQNILVLFNVEFIKSIYFKYNEVIYKNIYFVADTEKKYNWVINNFPKINCVLLKAYNINNLNECIKGFNVKKFDVVFSNPPYGNIDLDIMCQIFENSITKLAIIVHPAGWIFDLKSTSHAMKYKNRLSKYLADCYIFDGEESFKIPFHFPQMISTFKLNNSSGLVNVKDSLINKKFQGTIFDISIFGTMKNKLYDELISKIHNSLLSNKSIDKKYQFALMRIIGNSRKENDNENSGYPFFGPKFFTLIPKSMASREKYSLKTHDVFSFDTEIELNNFKQFLKTKIARICLAWEKISQNIFSGQRANIVPWMDFTQEWNDKKLCEEFGISEELWNYINNFILYSVYKIKTATSD